MPKRKQIKNINKLIYDIKPVWTYNQIRNIVLKYMDAGLDIEKELKNQILKGYIIYQKKLKFI